MNMIVNGYNPETIQPSQSLQPLQPEASPENKARVQKCVQHFHNLLLPNLPSNQLSKEGISFTLLKRPELKPPNKFELTIQRYDHYTNNYCDKTIIIPIHCPEKSTHQYLCVGTQEIFWKFPADFYVGYWPSTLELKSFEPQPQGFAMRDQFDHNNKVGPWVWNIERKNLDTNIGQLFDLNYLWNNSQPKNKSQPKTISYV